MVKKEAMELLSLTLENWGQYKQEKVEFQTQNNGKTPVIYFIGENGAGKTRLFEAIKCALFGPFRAEIIGEKGFKKELTDLYELFPSEEKQKLFNAFLKGETDLDAIMRLIITFSLKKDVELSKYYKITRSWKFFNFSKMNGRIQPREIKEHIEFKTKDEGDLIWNDVDVEDLPRRLEDWIPEPVRDFYFFDGEKLSKTMENPQTAEIQEHALMKSDWYPIEKVIYPTLDEVSNSFSKQAMGKKRKDKLVQDAEKGVNNVDTKLKKQREKFKNLEDQIKENRKDIQNLDVEFKQKYGEIRIDDFLKDSQNRSVLDEIRKLEADREQVYQEIANIMGENRSKRYDLEMIFIEKILNEVIDDLKDKEQKGIIPVKLDKSIFEYLIEKPDLLCEICSGKLTLEQEKAIDEKLNIESKKFLNDILKIQSSFPEVKKGLVEKRDDFYDLSKKLGRKERPKTKVDIKALQDYLEYKEKIDQLDKSIQRANNEIDKVKADIIKLDKERKTKERLLRTRRSNYGKIEDSDLHEFASQQIRDIFGKIREELNENLQSYIRKRTTQTFLRLIPDSNLFKKVIINDEWKFGYTHSSNPNVPIYDASKGQFHVIGLSFLHSLSGIARTDLPIIFDTPFGRLGRRPKINIGSNIAKLFKGTQVILFLTEEEANNMLQFIDGKYGYQIINKTGKMAKIIPCDDNRLREIIQTWKTEDEK